MKYVVLFVFIFLRNASAEDFVNMEGVYHANTQSNYTMYIMLDVNGTFQMESRSYPVDCEPCEAKQRVWRGTWVMRGNRVVVSIEAKDPYIFNVEDNGDLRLTSADLAPQDKLFSLRFSKHSFH